MSSMVSKTFISLALVPTALLATPVAAQQADEWDRARAQLTATYPGQIAPAISRWEYLTETRGLNFESYASFILTYPGLPKETTLKLRAENALETEFVSPERLLAYFDKVPPIGNNAKALYALALHNTGRPEAADWARKAWRGGAMSGTAEASLLTFYGNQWTAADHDTRMDALLWQGQTEPAARLLNSTSAEKRATFMARLTLAQGQDPDSVGVQTPANARSDAGYIYNRSQFLRKQRRTGEAIRLMADQPALTVRPHDQIEWVEELLEVAEPASPLDTVKIAQTIDAAFTPNEDISKREFKLRDDYTTLMWKGGTNALWRLNQPLAAAPLFYRYGAAARTPQTRSKGFYWAGLAAQQGGDLDAAGRYYNLAAQYPERFYGQMALQAMGQPMPDLSAQPDVPPTAEQREAFNNRPLVKAVREVARNSPWRTSIHFFNEIADQAETPAEHWMVVELARDLGRRDLAVIAGEAAAADGHRNFHTQAFPRITPPTGANWTMVHAITRQESQFAQNAISHAGARGLMQLMPGTAREQARLVGRSYMSSALISDPLYNMQLGDAYFARMLRYYDGSYPLAIAAYNAGPGNVNKWLRQNGDPRTGAVSWAEWIERMGFFETKNYVQRVIENAVVYEALNPGKTAYGTPRPVSFYLQR